MNSVKECSAVTNGSKIPMMSAQASEYPFDQRLEGGTFRAGDYCICLISLASSQRLETAREQKNYGTRWVWFKILHKGQPAEGYECNDNHCLTSLN